MKFITRIIRKFIRACKHLFGVLKGLFLCWLPYLKKNPQKIYLLPKWFWTCFFGSPHKKGYPWFSFEAVEWLDKFLTKEMKVFEWGSGGSTIYFVKKVSSLISVESNPEWHKKVAGTLKEKNITNCQYILKEPQASDRPEYPYEESKHRGLDFKEYCQIIDEYPDNYFDLVVVDGVARSFCIRHALKKIKAGGFLLLDDSEQVRHTAGIEELKALERRDFTAPKFYIYRCHHAAIWKIT